jgi:acetyl esterase/lipase
MADDQPVVEGGVVFGSGGGEALTCDVYSPREGDAPRAAMLLLRSRGAPASPELVVLSHLLTRKGHVCVVPEFRVGFRWTEDQGFKPHPPETWPAPLHDAKAAVRWTSANYERLGIDPERIVLYGASNAGLVALVAAGTADDPRLEGTGGNDGVSSRVAAVIAANSPTRLSQWGIPLIVGAGAPQERVDEASPITHVSGRFPPAMFLHGTDDQVIPPSSSESMFRALREADAKAELHLYAGQGHGFAVQPMFINHTADLLSLFVSRYAPEHAEAAP